MSERISWVGLDVHKRDIVVAGTFPDVELAEWTIEHTASGVRKLAKRLLELANGGKVVACYEAGPCGYELQRRLQDHGIDCRLIAPSLIPYKPGDRIKTDRRDAKKLMDMLRASLLTEVRAPTREEEAIRDLCRVRDDAREDLQRARQRLGKMLLRRGLSAPENARPWTEPHRRWLRQLRFENKTDQTVFDHNLLALEHVETRIRSLDEQLVEASRHPLVAKQVGWLRCFRGIDVVTAMAIVAELHGIERFDSPRKLMAYIGLVPSEHSSGDREQRGAITKAGNSLVRRLLIEAAWHYRHRSGAGPALRRRREGQPLNVIAIADRAQTRLNRRYWRLAGRQKNRKKIVVALARELAGFVWAALTIKDSSPIPNAA